MNFNQYLIESSIPDEDKLSDKEFNNLLKWKRTDNGLVKEIKGKVYRVEQNEITKDWHLYIDDEWSEEVESRNTGKLVAIMKAFDIENEV